MIAKRITFSIVLFILIFNFIVYFTTYSFMRDTLHAERLETVGQVADAKRDELVALLAKQNRLLSHFLSDTVTHCSYSRFDRDCFVRRMSAYLNGAQAVSMVLSYSADEEGEPLNQITVGGQLPVQVITQTGPGQLATLSPYYPTADYNDIRSRLYVISVELTKLSASPLDIGAESGLQLPASSTEQSLTELPYTDMPKRQIDWTLQLSYPAAVLNRMFDVQTGLRHSGEIFLADAKGYFVTPSRHKSEQGHLRPITATPLQACLKGTSGEALKKNYREETALHAFRFMPEVGAGCIVAEIDAIEAYAPLAEMKKIFITLGLCFTLIGLLVAMLVSRPIVRPIQSLIEVARRIHQGEHRIHAPVEGNKGELDELATVFNSLTRSLLDLNQQLEEGVEQRTEALEWSKRRIENILDNAQDGIISVDESGTIETFNRSAEQVFGYEAEEVIGKGVSILMPNSDQNLHADYLGNYIRTGEKHVIGIGREVVGRHKEGHDILLHLSVSETRWRERRFFVGSMRDITQEKANQNELKLLASVFQCSGEAVAIVDSAHQVVRVNGAFTAVTGYSADEVVGGALPFFRSDIEKTESGKTGKASPQVSEIWQILEAHGVWQGEIQDRHKQGHSYTLWVCMSVLRDENQNVKSYIVSFSDVSQLKNAESRVRYLAHHDPLTGLLNRFALVERITQAAHTAGRERKKVAILFIDLDQFKRINDTMGHSTGDAVLMEVAYRLTQSVRMNDVIGRLGGDEFVIALENVDSVVEVESIAEKVRRSLASSYRINGSRLHTSPSIGVALYPEHGSRVDTVIQNADLAMYQAKLRGRNNVQFFNKAMDEANKQRTRFEESMRRSWEKREFVLFYQPKIDMVSRKVCGVEALLRWQDPNTGMVMPDQFIPIAEETGLILLLDEWVLRTACSQLRRWIDNGLEAIEMSVNLSAQQFLQAGLPAMVAHVLRDYDIRPEWLELEVTEHVAIENPKQTSYVMEQLREIGVRLAIDDFGTGYSSLGYLQKFPVTCLKLDRQFVCEIDTSSHDTEICTATIGLAHKLGLEVVAEGVETQAQFNCLQQLHCDKIQGFFYSKALTAEHAEAFISAERDVA